MIKIIKERGFFLTATILLVLILAACGGEPEEEAVSAAPTATIAEVEQVVEPVNEPVNEPVSEPVSEPAVVLPPVVVVMTNTPVPATETPLPTATPEATNTLEPTAVPPTAVPFVPTAVPPTAVPPTEPPPPPPPPAIGANGLIASKFDVENTSAGKNEGVWFDFTVANSTGSDVGYNSLGVMPRKDGVDIREWYQQSYSGRDSKIRPGGFSWRDRIKIPESGNYTIRLVMCFDGFDVCTTGGGNFQTLSNEVAVTIR